MTDDVSVVPLSDAQQRRDEQRRREECAVEPIRTPGLIQSYGLLLAVDETTGTVVVASENAAHWLGRSLAEAEDETVAWALANGSAVDPLRVDFDGGPCDMIVHRGTAPLLVEFERVVPDLAYVRTGVVSAIQRLSHVTDPEVLCTTAAAEMKALTGFDRVMCYRFHRDGHGEIVADEREPDMEPYLGLHFPASDIPSQARALYLEKRSRVIAHTEDPGIPLVGAVADPLDLGATELRMASPHHLQFMRNMGQVATLSFAVVVADELVGMFTLAHRAPRRPPVLLRRALEVMASQVGTQLAAAEEIRRLRRELDARERRGALVAPLYGARPAEEVLLRGRYTVLDLIPAEGAHLRLGGTVHTLGRVPDTAELDAVLASLSHGFVSEALPEQRPDLAAAMPGVAGLLTVPLSDDGDALTFFRGDVTREVVWLGDQSAANRADPLSPRRSFSAWRESVVGRSTPWGVHERDARDLAEAIREGLARRRDAELAELAHHDPLTGLHNRRYLDDHLASLADADGDVALIFLDLDDFKLVNDRHGHETGDAVLTAVGRRLAACARATDVVARLGGDEFVIVLGETSADAAQGVADRALEALGEPVVVAETIIAVTASAGVVAGPARDAARELLDEADAAMYRAKRAGRGRLSA